MDYFWDDWGADEWSTAIGVGAQVGSAWLQSDAAKDAAKATASAAGQAADTSLQATREAIESQEKMYQTNLALQEPWREVGTGALYETWQLMHDPEAFQKSPYYDFLQAEGLQAIDRAASAAGELNSGERSKDLMRFGQGLASGQFQNYLNNLTTLSGMGQGSTDVLTQAGQQTGQNISDIQQQSGVNLGNLAMQAGNARASNYTNQGNVWGNALNNVGGLAYLYGTR